MQQKKVSTRAVLLPDNSTIVRVVWQCTKQFGFGREAKAYFRFRANYFLFNLSIFFYIVIACCILQRLLVDLAARNCFTAALKLVANP